MISLIYVSLDETHCSERIVADQGATPCEVTVFALLLTDPKHQGRGAGTILLRRCIEDATSVGLPIYLNASEAAHGLYLKHQFRDLQLMETDFGKWGMTEPIQTWAMIKEL